MPLERRVKLIYVYSEFIVELLNSFKEKTVVSVEFNNTQVPSNASVLGCHFHPEFNCWAIILWHESFEIVHEGQHPPILSNTWETSFEVNSYLDYQRLNDIAKSTLKEVQIRNTETKKLIEWFVEQKQNATDPIQESTLNECLEKIREHLYVQVGSQMNDFVETMPDEPLPPKTQHIQRYDWYDEK